MRSKILVPVVLFGCLYAGVASAKAPHAMASTRSASPRATVRAERAPSAAPVRSEARRSEIVTQRSGTSIDRTRTQRHYTAPHNASLHSAILRQALENLTQPTSEAEPIVDGDDGVVTAPAADQASA